MSAVQQVTGAPAPAGSRTALRARLSSLALALVASAGVFGPGAGEALAADQAPAAAEADSTTLEQIVVTARRREEALIDVPVAVTVITAKEIEEAGITRVEDYIRLTPNVTFQNSLNLGQNFISIRGFSSVQYAPPPVAVVVDGVLQMTPYQFNIEQLDLSQIEVLKGPQGAVYGRNAIAGAINITTRRPGEELEGEVMAGYGSGDDFRMRGVVHAPIVPGKVGFSGAISWADRQGQIRNETTGLHVDHYDDISARARLLFNPNDRVEVDLKYAYSDTDGGDPSFILTAPGNPNEVDGPVISDFVGSNPRQMHDLSARASVTFDAGTLSAILAYVNVDEALHSDFDFLPLPIAVAHQSYADEGFSQEVRFTSPQDGRLRWIVGAYHLRLEHDVATLAEIDPGFLIFDPPIPLGLMPFAQFAEHNVLVNNSIYGQAEFDITDRLELGLAARYDHDDLSQDAVDVLAGVAFPSKEASFDKFQPKVTLSYELGVDVRAYASYGQGFRSGAFNQNGASFGGPIILPEEAATYEVGLKAEMFDRRLALSLAAFHTDLENSRVIILDFATGVNVGLNIDEVSLQGFEAAAAARLAPGLEVSAGLGVTDGEIKKFTDDPALVGNRPPKVPSYTLNLSLSYQHPIGPDWDGFFRVDYEQIGTLMWDVANTAERDEVHDLSARIGISRSAGGVSLTLWGKNLFDERRTSEYLTFRDTGHFTGLDAYFPPRPRSFGVELGYRF